MVDALGVWHWGNTAFGFAWDGTGLVASSLSSGTEAYRFRLAEDGSLVGGVGYHRGERLQVVRDEDGTVNHLVYARLLLTLGVDEGPSSRNTPNRRGSVASSPGRRPICCSVDDSARCEPNTPPRRQRA